MLLYPEVMLRAQQELDTAVGRERPPILSDFDNLPYDNALIHEVLRWRPITPLGTFCFVDAVTACLYLSGFIL